MGFWVWGLGGGGLNNKHCVFHEWRSYDTDSDRFVDVLNLLCPRSHYPTLKLIPGVVISW